MNSGNNYPPILSEEIPERKRETPSAPPPPEGTVLPEPSDKQKLLYILNEIIFNGYYDAGKFGSEDDFCHNFAANWGKFTFDAYDQVLLTQLPEYMAIQIWPHFIGSTKNSLKTFIRNIAPEPNGNSIKLYKLLSTYMPFSEVLGYCWGTTPKDVKNFTEILELFHPAVRAHVLTLYCQQGAVITSEPEARSFAPLLPLSAYEMFCQLQPPCEVHRPWFSATETPTYLRAFIHGFLPHDLIIRTTEKRNKLLTEATGKMLSRIDETKIKKAIYLSQVIISIESLLACKIPQTPAASLEEFRESIWQSCLALSPNSQFHNVTVRENDRSKVIASDTKTVVDNLFETLLSEEFSFSAIERSPGSFACSSSFGFTGPAQTPFNPTGMPPRTFP